MPGEAGLARLPPIARRECWVLVCCTGDTLVQGLEYLGWQRTAVTGWGTTREGGLLTSETLRKVKVPPVSDAECKATYDALGFPFSYSAPVIFLFIISEYLYSRDIYNTTSIQR